MHPDPQVVLTEQEGRHWRQGGPREGEHAQSVWSRELSMRGEAYAWCTVSHTSVICSRAVRLRFSP